MKKILIILTGGTFGMAAKKEAEELSPSPLDGEWIIRLVPELKDLAHVDWISILNIDSSDMSPSHWEAIARTIQGKYDNYDGFVVIHGTDTMVYSATALSFIMQKTKKPVIFTGSQKPLKSIRTDARNNLIGAVELARLNIPEIAIFFNNTLLRANRTTKVSTEDYEAFFSYNYPPLAKIGVKVHLKENRFEDYGEPTWKFGFDTGIIAFKMFPGFDANLLESIRENKKVKGIIIEAFGAGNIPDLDYNWLDFIAKTKEEQKIVIVRSQCQHGQVDLNLYANGKKALQMGAIASKDMTTETSIVKLMFALYHKKSYNELVNFITQVYCGEMSNN